MVMGKVTVVAPAGTVTVAGTLGRAGLGLVRVTVVPPVGAGASRVRMPLEGTKEWTLVGLSARLSSAGA